MSVVVRVATIVPKSIFSLNFFEEIFISDGSSLTLLTLRLIIFWIEIPLASVDFIRIE